MRIKSIFIINEILYTDLFPHLEDDKLGNESYKWQFHYHEILIDDAFS